MVAGSIPQNQLVSNESRYQIYPSTMLNQSSSLGLSVKQIGILTPLIVHQFGDTFHVVDGFKRIDLAKALNIEELPCTVLPEESKPLTIATLLLQKDEMALRNSAVRKSLFLALCQKLGIDNDEQAPLLAILNIENHSRVIRQYLNVAELPHEVLSFCDEKGFSLKQCMHLSKHPRLLLNRLFQWREQLHFTAAIIEEILGHFKDVMRAENIDLKHIEEEESFIAIMQSKSNNQQRTQALRNWLRLRRYPRLSAIQKNMQCTVSDMGLPKAVKLDWDKSLENRALTITANITEPDQWPDICVSLADSATQNGINLLLEQL
ncbi:MAG: ParB-like nuclease domain-containing protein [Pseudomonadales bacterium]|nr:ParB-like nuclease domain-containing protein [Pseudomonadales bacterium]